MADVLRELDRLALRGEEQQAWMAELRRTAKGEVRGSFHNSVLILAHDERYAERLRLDEMRGVVALGDAEMTDAAISAIRVDLEKRYAIQPSEADTVRAVQLVASNNAFHPVRDYLAGLTWDGVVAARIMWRLEILRVRSESKEEADVSLRCSCGGGSLHSWRGRSCPAARWTRR